MNHEQYFIALRKNLEFGLELMKRKNHDYAGGEDPFKNFRAAEMLGMSVEEGILVRMSDKLSRAANLLKMKINDARVKEESVKDTLIDLMNYANILVTYLEYGEKQLKLFNEAQLNVGPQKLLKLLEEEKSYQYPQHDCNKANCNDMKHY